MLPDLHDLAEYVVRQYPSARKIVEVGVGWLPHIALELKRRLPATRVIVVDADDSVVSAIRSEHPSIECLWDDVLEPRRSIYRGASLIYSIRPPPELHRGLADLGADVKADVLIRTLGREGLSAGRHSWRFGLVNSGKASFYLARFRTATRRT